MFTQCVCASVAGSCTFIDFDHTHSGGRIFLLMAVQLTLDFDIQLLRSIYQKNHQAMAIVLVQES